MIREAISDLVRGRHLTREAAAAAMREIMDGETTPAQTAAFITALAIKGEMIDEITGCAEVMRAKATRIHAEEPLVDTCGTGGDRAGTFNISTAAALVTAGAGVRVAKHGNRAASSSSGSADVLAELGVNLDADVPTVERCIAEAGIGFMFAPKLHAAMKHAMGPRREIGIRTIFNLLGPLTNPACARHQVLGVYQPELVPVLATVLRNLGSDRVYVVCGADGLDEITTTDETHVAELRDGRIESYRIRPEDFGVRRAAPGDLRVASAKESADVIRSVLAGQPGPARDIVMLNAGAAVAASGVAEDIARGAEAAAQAIDSGGAAAALARLVLISQGSAGGGDAKQYVIHVDGGARGNPGPAGWGYVIADARGRRVEARGRYIGEATNNVAEYQGLIAAATRAAELGAEGIVFRVDSELLCRQVNGSYRVKAAHLKPLHTEVMAALRRLHKWSVVHVRREQNSLADEMVNRAIDVRGDAE